MTTIAIEAVRKFHASLNVTDLNRSVAFYRVLFGRKAAKQYHDYAKFELEDPGLVLSLIPSQAGATGGALNHAGLRVSSSEELVDIQRRVEEAGFPTRREDGVECCYARQTKFWVADPDQTLWEIYVFHENIGERGSGLVPKIELAAKTAAAFAKEVPRARVKWDHRIPDPLPSSIPHADNSLDEIHLEGTINLKTAPAALTQLLVEAFRALRPGGLLRLHGLAGDHPLPIALPPLPGPAAVVQHVPAAVEPMNAITAARFVEVQFEKLSQTAHFTIAGVPMRELVLTARKPGFRPKKMTHQAVYLGPLAKVTDDFGNTFPRGERVALNIHDWQVLSRSQAASQFLLSEAGVDTLASGCCSSAE